MISTSWKNFNDIVSQIFGPSPSCKLPPDLEPGHDMRGFLHLIVELRGANWAARGLLDHHAQK